MDLERLLRLDDDDLVRLLVADAQDTAGRDLLDRIRHDPWTTHLLARPAKLRLRHLVDRAEARLEEVRRG